MREERRRVPRMFRFRLISQQLYERKKEHEQVLSSVRSGAALVPAGKHVMMRDR